MARQQVILFAGVLSIAVTSAFAQARLRGSEQAGRHLNDSVMHFGYNFSTTDGNVDFCKHLCGSEAQGVGCDDPTTEGGAACWNQCYACCAQDPNPDLGDLSICCNDPSSGFRTDDHGCPEDSDTCVDTCGAAVGCFENDDDCWQQCKACCTQDATLGDLSVCCPNYRCEGFAFDDFQCATDMTIANGEEARVYNENGDVVVMLLGGLDGDYCNHGQYMRLAQAIAQYNYCVILLRGNDANPSELQVPGETIWAVSLAIAVRDNIANGRPLAVLGHSLGGAGALAISEQVPGLAAYIAMHPFAFLAPRFDTTNGPLLITTGTLDEGYSPVDWLPQVASESEALNSFQHAQAIPRAFVDATGNYHGDPFKAERGFGGIEFQMMLEWLACYTRGGDTDDACGKFVNTCESCEGDGSCKSCSNIWN